MFFDSIYFIAQFYDRKSVAITMKAGVQQKIDVCECAYVCQNVFAYIPTKCYNNRDKLETENMKPKPIQPHKNKKNKMGNYDYHN